MSLEDEAKKFMQGKKKFFSKANGRDYKESKRYRSYC